MTTTTPMTDLHVGQHVSVSGYTHGSGTFAGYGDPKHSCPPDHISYPGMRIAYVVFDRYGKQPIWEDRITAS